MILFDGVCNLCNRSVQFVIERDPRAVFRFASLQSRAAAALLNTHRRRQPMPDSIALIDNGRVYTESTAALRIARHLRFPWNLAWCLLVVPRPIRDAAYAWVARNRYRWFGRGEVCMVPGPELRERFLAD